MSASFPYPFGYGNVERERLVAQSLRFAPITERFLCEAGVGEGQRVLDVGSGLGDVAMAAARLVRGSGTVVGVERSAESIAVAEERVAAAGYANVRFTQAELTSFETDGRFDALIGRLVLEFQPTPAETLKSLTALVRSGGIIAFQEPFLAAVRGFAPTVPLWNACVSLTIDALSRFGADANLGSKLHRVFVQAGLPGPITRIDMLFNDSTDLATWPCDTVCRTLAELANVDLDIGVLGDLRTLRDRVSAEIRSAGCLVPSVPLVGAWSRKP